MKDYRLILAYSTCIFATSFLFHSITTANAYPNGVNISMGSNPNFSFYSQNCTSNETVTTVPVDQVLIITDIASAITYDSDTIVLSTSSTTLGKFRMDFYTPPYYGGLHSTRSTDQSGTYANNMVSLRNGIVVPTGESLLIQCNSNQVTITGYFARQ